MLNIRDLKIDNASLGDKLLLVEVVPVYEYKDKQRTDNLIGYRSRWRRISRSRDGA